MSREPQPSTRVFIAKNQSYTGNLARTIRDGLIATGLQPAGLKHKRVLLKPNMIEPSRAARHMTTHPAVLLAVAQEAEDAVVAAVEAARKCLAD